MTEIVTSILNKNSLLYGAEEIEKKNIGPSYVDMKGKKLARYWKNHRLLQLKQSEKNDFLRIFINKAKLVRMKVERMKEHEYSRKI